jgi:hypothetical protein
MKTKEESKGCEVIEESMLGQWNVDVSAKILGSIPGMLLSPKRLVTYFYPLLLQHYR